MIKINGIELEDIDLLDADTAETIEEILESVKKEGERISKLSNFSEMIREQCNFISDAFDKIFGEGTSEQLFEGKSNLRVSIAAFDELMNVITVKQGEAEKEFSKYSPNRATRRVR